MKSLSVVLAIGLASGVACLAAPASSAPTCADPDHPITGTTGFEAVVGTRKVKTVELGLYAGRGCDVDGAVAVLTGPSRTIRVVLHEAPGEPDLLPRWTGSLRLDPKDLRNADAGAWSIRYEVTGPVSDSSDNVGHLRRATRASFNAGPEPVRHGKITFAGRLERASWDSHRYRGIGRTVSVQKVARDGVDEADVVSRRTGSDGRFRTTVGFPGASTYWLNYDGDEVSGASTSRRDRVVAG